jgi:integrase
MGIKLRFANNLQTFDKIRSNKVKNILQICSGFDIIINPEFEKIMKTVSVVLDTRRRKTDGTYPVKIYYSYKRGSYFIAAGISVAETDFAGGLVVNHRKAAVYNRIIAQKLDYVKSVLEELAESGRLKTEFSDPKRLYDFIKTGELETERQEAAVLNTFSATVQKYVESKELSASSKGTYRVMLRKIAGFCDIEKLDISDINFEWLTRFDRFCSESGMNVNGKGIYLRNIRTVYNFAVDLETVPLESYPFRRFKIKKAETAHRNISIEDLRHIIYFDCESFKNQQLKCNKHSSGVANPAKYRDLFMLSFYFCGLNMQDLLFLKPDDIRNGQLSILRRKTGVPVVIRVEPEAQAIIDRYRGKKYLLNFLDSYATDDTHSFIKRVNKNLKLILPFISVYWARHSWASIAAELDVPDSIIDIAMGHKIRGMASVYIARNLKKVSDANRKVIDYLQGKITD